MRLAPSALGLLIFMTTLQQIEPATLKFNSHLAVSLSGNGTSFIASAGSCPASCS